MFDGALTEETVDGIRIIRHGSRSFFNFHVPVQYYRKFHNENFDIVIDDVNKIPFYTPLFVKEPLAAISHHFFGKSIYRESNLVSASYVYITEKLMDFVYKKTPFAVVSESTRREFLDRGYKAELFTIIHNAISEQLFNRKFGQKNNFFNVTYFGRLKKYKSVDHLLQAFAIVKPKIPDAKLYILGRGDYQPELEKLAVRLKIDKQTTFFGYVSEDNKMKLLSESHCMVNTSMKEGWGITNIEANACGTPVISADVPGLRDSVKEGQSGLLYEYGNINQLADYIYEIYEDNEKRQLLSEGAVAWAKSFSWDESARKMIEFCEKVITGARSL